MEAHASPTASVDASEQRKALILQEVKICSAALRALRTLLPRFTADVAGPWLQRIDTILTRKPAHTTIAVAGETGAGKSSIINALLGETSLIPTSSMRACTAAVTQISWNDKEGQSYRASIVPRPVGEWRRELELFFTDVRVARETADDDESEAGVAFQQIAAVYPQIDLENLGMINVDTLIEEPEVSQFLTSGLQFEAETAEELHQKIEGYIGSNQTHNNDVMQYWPLVSKVCIYTRAPVLATGCVLIDLPGIADSNVARVAVARRHLEHSEAVWVVAPIIRAASSQSGKKLLGDGIRRQLHRDGIMNRLTFVPSKIDEIDIKEILPVLEQDPDFAREYASIESARKEVMETTAAVCNNLRDLKQRFDDMTAQAKEAHSEQKVYKALKKLNESGKPAYPPMAQNHRAKRQRVAPILDVSQPPLAGADIRQKLDELDELRDRLDDECQKLAIKLDEAWQEKKDGEQKIKAYREEAWFACVRGRNEQSIKDIQRDFVQGMRELNKDNSQDDKHGGPTEDVYDEQALARMLPVKCVSARGYKKLTGGMQGQELQYISPTSQPPA